MEIGDRIRAARMRRKMTQLQLAELVGVNPTAVVLWENKKNRRNISGDHLRKVADALNVSVSELLGEKHTVTSVQRSDEATVTVNRAEKTLLELFRSFPESLQLLQLANFVECAKLRQSNHFTGHKTGDGLPIDAAANG